MYVDIFVSGWLRLPWAAIVSHEINSKTAYINKLNRHSKDKHMEEQIKH